MTTQVTFYIPYIQSGKRVRVTQRSPSTGKSVGGELFITDAMKVYTYTIHDGAMLLTEEVNAEPVVLPSDAAPQPVADQTAADVVNAAITGG